MAVHSGTLRDVNIRYKENAKRGWATIFGRILVGYLDANLNYGDIDLITPNPGFGSRSHNEGVITAARSEDPFWPWDEPPWTISKTRKTTKSKSLTAAGKRAAAREHVEALEIRTSRVRGRRILVYDDVCERSLKSGICDH